MNVVDTLVTVLRLDNRQFERAAKDSADTTRKLRDGQDRAAKDMDRGATRAAGSYRVLRNEVVGLFLAFTGANSIRQFTAGIVSSDAATGRLADNLGVAVERLSAWQGALKSVGASESEANAIFQRLTDLRTNWLLKGDSGADAELQGLGVNPNDLQSVESTLYKLAEAGQRMDRVQFQARLSSLGLSGSAATLLSKGPSGVKQLIDEQEKLGGVSKESAKAAQDFEKAWEELQRQLTESARPAVVELTKALTDMAADKEGLNDFFSGLASGIAQVTRGFRLARAGIGDFVTMYKQIRAGDFAGAWQTFQHGEAERVANKKTPTRVNTIMPTTGASGWPHARLFERLIMQESGGRAGIAGPMTPYGQAHGMTQMLDSTARDMARKLSVPWRPDLMRSKTAEGAAYQRQLGQAYFQQGLDKYGGDERRALMFYHGGPNERLWGAKTRAYADSIMGGRSPGMAARSAASGGGSSTLSVGQITIYTAATDAKGIAHDMRGALASRNLVLQSGTGVNP